MLNRLRHWGVLACLGVLAVSLALILRNDVWRAVEARLTAVTMDLLLGMDATAPAWSNLIVLTAPSPHGLVVTPDCTSGFLLGAVGLVMGPLFLLRRMAGRRLVMALGVVWSLILLTNLVRLAWTALAIQEWGLEQGLRIGHDYLGTVLTTVGTSLSGLVAILLILPSAAWRAARRGGPRPS